jgi:hypothetical protein
VPLHQPPAKQTADDQSLAEMAHRLEAALRRPTHPAAEPTPAGSAMTKPVSEPMTRPSAAADMTMPAAVRPAAPVAPPPPPAAGGSPAPAPAAAEPARAPAEPKMPKVVRPESKPAAKAVYDSLEQEMASLLGRPSGKT